MSDTIEPIDARQARCLTVKRAIAISYGTDGRYEELDIRPGAVQEARPVLHGYERFIFDRDFRYRNLGRIIWTRCWADSTGRA